MEIIVDSTDGQIIFRNVFVETWAGSVPLSRTVTPVEAVPGEVFAQAHAEILERYAPMIRRRLTDT